MEECDATGVKQKVEMNEKGGRLRMKIERN
jgi:hypothetical protein